MRNKRYEGEFLSRQSMPWKVEIWQEGWAGEVGEIRFSADEAVIMEWPERAKHEAVCGATCTVTVISPGDRTYIDLYRVDSRDVQVRIYMGGSLYWTGLIDAEIYEEPYESAQGYDVRLTFSDFGSLERLKFEGEGTMSVKEIVRRCVFEQGRIFDGFFPNLSYMSTEDANGNPLQLDDIYVDSANFIDEDGEAMSAKEVLEGVLMPLGMRIEQRYGLWIYDLNGIALGETEPVRWSSTEQTYGVDSIYNECRVTFSPYVKTGVLNNPELMSDDRIDANILNLNNHTPRIYEGMEGWSYPAVMTREAWRNSYNCGFTLWTLPDVFSNDVTLRGGARAARIIPQLKGEDKRCVALYWPSYVGTGNGASQTHGSTAITNISAHHYGITSENSLQSIIPEGGGMAVVETSAVVPKLSNMDVVNINMDVLLATMNPFSADDRSLFGYDDSADTLKKMYQILMIPAAITLVGVSGQRYKWNAPSALSTSYQGPWANLGAWSEWDGITESAVTKLAVYDAEILRDTSKECKSSVINAGWVSVKLNVGAFVNRLGVDLFGENRGQKLPAPPEEGELTVKIMDRGWRLRSRDDANYPNGSIFMYDNLNNWLLVTVPEISVEPKYYGEYDTSDVEYTSALNAEAHEPLEIDTICGTCETPRPMARGLYLNADGEPIGTLRRGVNAGRPESLLMGTMYSQYAEPHIKLTGEMSIHRGIKALAVATEPGRKFMRVGTSQNAILGVEDAILSQLSEDEYIGNE